MGVVLPGALINTSSLGQHTFMVTATEVAMNSAYATRDYTVIPADQEGPVVSNVAADPNPVEVDTPVSLTATVSDTGSGDSVVAFADYSLDGAAFLPMTAVDGSFDAVTEDATVGLGAFAQPGVHELCATGTDSPGNVIAAQCIFLAVYDPDGGFVTGGGWFNSPAGAYTADLDLTGKANFGFVSKYQQGANVPTGETEFQFKAGDLNLHSTSYDWLVVAGPHAKFKGDGTINGVSGYMFQVTTTDGAVNGGGGTDKFRIKIVDTATDMVVYDNQPGDDDQADATTDWVAGQSKSTRVNLSPTREAVLEAASYATRRFSHTERDDTAGRTCRPVAKTRTSEHLTRHNPTSPVAGKRFLCKCLYWSRRADSNR